jgi:hypothetical protein
MERPAAFQKMPSFVEVDREREPDLKRLI